MAEKKRESTKRFGTRYGRHLREKIAEVESGHRGRKICPYCGKKNAKRLAAGIWSCKSCKIKFTGRAYSLGNRATVKEEVSEEKVVEREIKNLSSSKVSSKLYEQSKDSKNE